MIVVTLTPQNNAIEGKYSPQDVVLVMCDATDAAFTVTMPDAKFVADTRFVVVKSDSGANAVTVEGKNTEGTQQTIKGSTSQALASQADKVDLLSDRSNYW